MAQIFIHRTHHEPWGRVVSQAWIFELSTVKPRQRYQFRKSSLYRFEHGTMPIVLSWSVWHSPCCKRHGYPKA